MATQYCINAYFNDNKTKKDYFCFSIRTNIEEIFNTSLIELKKTNFILGYYSPNKTVIIESLKEG